MKIINLKHWLKIFIIGLFYTFLITLNFTSSFADNRDNVKSNYSSQLINLGWDNEIEIDIESSKRVDEVINFMESNQLAVDDTINGIEKRINSIPLNDTRKNKALNALSSAKVIVDQFKNIDADNHLYLNDSIGGVLPRIVPDQVFEDSYDKALAAIVDVNRVLLDPSRPGNVPEGDIIEDFIPQLIRLLFKFSSIVILISFVVSGVYFVISFSNEEMVTKAKNILYFTLIGFAFVIFAFAIVTALTDINFFKLF